MVLATARRFGEFVQKDVWRRCEQGVRLRSSSRRCGGERFACVWIDYCERLETALSGKI